MSDIALVLATFADRGEAETIGTAMVEEELAACVNIAAPCTSIYRWHGKVERAEEVQALFKTTIAVAPRLVARIAERHSYDLPAIEIVPAAAGEALAAWIAASTR
ncbi:divalent-cation tolerance protein CutA [Sphingomonas cannabina]|uniref:divalent-cation tolerance protein CutA n=1 Tax=Sphingomonas cannabina TaxID=2899123 RepID=UPI001F1A36FC|nr:divalent-cation tolerance protein CutA [Sphingomonas cannabina]UIJ46876.1 divalent-cation tolerance protein CutA [Sphingomonas cannabina]